MIVNEDLDSIIIKLLDLASSGKIFMKIDVKSGYYFIGINQDDK
jgi:hypothetical protein